MKKTLIAGFVLALCSQSAMAADDWRFAAGADVWAAQGQWSGLWPPVLMAAMTTATTGTAICNWNTASSSCRTPSLKSPISAPPAVTFKNDLTAYDLSLYYRLFNNDLFKIDLGMTGRHYDGEQVYFKGRQGL